MTCPMSHSKLVAEPGLEPRLQCIKTGLIQVYDLRTLPPTLWATRSPTTQDCNPIDIWSLDTASAGLGPWELRNPHIIR